MDKENLLPYQVVIIMFGNILMNLNYEKWDRKEKGSF